ncbi:hypothetical protein V8F20_008549 [Naviculisporaceae sp. PSN 640]
MRMQSSREFDHATCADLDTYKRAVEDPERYNLVRVRVGGWTEFYTTMFPAHQEQHQRRGYFTPWKEGVANPSADGKNEKDGQNEKNGIKA